MGYNPSYKWINPTYPIYDWGYNPLTKLDEPPSRGPFSAMGVPKSYVIQVMAVMDDHDLVWLSIYKVVPRNDSVQLVQITPITMVFVGDMSIVNGVYKPNDN